MSHIKRFYEVQDGSPGVAILLDGVPRAVIPPLVDAVRVLRVPPVPLRTLAPARGGQLDGRPDGGGGGSEVVVVAEALAVREVVRAAVGVAGAVAEGVAVAERAEDGHRAGVVAPGAAAARGISRAAVVPGDVPVRVRPRGSVRQGDGNRGEQEDQMRRGPRHICGSG